MIAVFLLHGILLACLGVFALAAKYILPETHLPFWPVDGVLAIIGGLFLVRWSWREGCETDKESDDGSINDRWIDE